jgi:hypothetical protein
METKSKKNKGVRALRIRVDGSIEEHFVNGLDDMQKLVGGCVQVVELTTVHHDAYVNEDGMALGLGRNDAATKLCTAFEAGLHPRDYIKGDMLILGPLDKEGYNTSVTDGAVELIHQTLGKSS